VQLVPAAVAADELDLSSGQLQVPDALAATLPPGRDHDLRVRLPGLAEGTIRVRKHGTTFSTAGAGSAIRLNVPALAVIADQLPTVLVVTVRESVVRGWVGVGQPGSIRGTPRTIVDHLIRFANALGCLGMTNLVVPSVSNEFSGGRINVAVDNLGFRLGGWLEGTGSLRLDGANLSIEGGARVDVPNGSGGDLRVRRGPDGQLGGSLRMTVAVGPMSGTVVAALEQGFVHVQGTATYRTDRMNGSLTIIATDERTARDLTTRTDLDATQSPVQQPNAEHPARPGRRAFCGWGELEISLTPWLSGRARVIINDRAQATIIGEIRPQRELILFEEREWNRRLFRVEIRTGYGIPVVGQVFVFAAIGLEALARVGPGRIHNMSVSGQFSTDPRVENLFTITGSLNISAFAGLRLRAEGGVGLTLLGHDIRAGVGLNALAGIRGYVDAMPSIGRRHREGGRPEWFIHGHLEIAAQPFLGFSGDLFVEVDAPWWSPCPDRRWTWPLFNLEYPLPGQFGIGADVDYVLGSRRWPTISFGEVDFDSSKFMTDLLNDNAPRGRGAEQRRPGTWREGTGGGAPGGARNAGGSRAREAERAGGFDGPIGENMTFSDGGESHRLWIDDHGTEATPMVASRPGPVMQALREWEARLDMLRPGDRARARELIATARRQSRGVRDPATRQLALRTAQRNAREAYRRHGGGRGNRQRGRGPDPAAIRREVRQAEGDLRVTLMALATLMARVRFRPFQRSAPMVRGTELVEIRERDGHPRVFVARRYQEELLTEARAGQPFAEPVTQTGKNQIRNSADRILRIAPIVARARIVEGWINRLVRLDLDRPLNDVVQIVSRLGNTLAIPNLDRLRRILPLPSREVAFNGNPTRYPRNRNAANYRRIFRREMARQLRLQENGINRITLDYWLHNQLRYRMDSEIFSNLDRAGRTAVLDVLRERAQRALVAAQRHLSNLESWYARVEREIVALAGVVGILLPASASLRRALEGGRLELVDDELDEVARMFADQLQRIALIEDGLNTIVQARGDRRRIIIIDENGTRVVRPNRDDLRPERYRFVRRYTRRGNPIERIRYWELDIIGRMGNEVAFRNEIAPYRNLLRARNALWRRFPPGFNQLAVLHNPDQVAGGFDRWPDPEEILPRTTDFRDPTWDRFARYMMRYLGNSEVNSRIGFQWGQVMTNYAHELSGSPAYPAGAHPLWRMRLRFRMTPREGSE
jgi:hypothetical protein